MLNMFLDADLERARRNNSRKHFGRPHFAMWVDLEGKLQIQGDPDQRDHAQRCRDSLDEWYFTKQKLRWRNILYIAAIFALVFLSSVLYK